MRIFLSYASQDRAVIEPIRYALAEQGHDIFYDREDLQPGDAFDSHIRRAIERCDLFVCFLTPNTVDAGSYTLTELAIAQRVWAHPAGRVLPVLLCAVPFDNIPAYLKSVTLLEPVGNVTASVSDAVYQIARSRRRRQIRRAATWAVVALIPLSAVLYWAIERSGALTEDSSLALIEAGVFTMGDDEHSLMRQVYVGAFYIDKYEVTVERYAQFLAARGSLAPPDGWDQVDVATRGQLPVVGVSWNDAEAYCQWAGQRLPTEAEWEKAARDGDARVYPWGDTEPSAELAAYARSAEDAYEGGLMPVGSFPEGQSAEGVFDLAGNVAEWVSDWWSEGQDPNDVHDPSGPATGDNKVLRGSGWHDPADKLESTRRYHASEDQRLDDLGFRCARDA